MHKYRRSVDDFEENSSLRIFFEEEPTRTTTDILGIYEFLNTCRFHEWQITKSENSLIANIPRVSERKVTRLLTAEEII